MSEMEVRLSREMGLVDITMIGVGAMIGAGIFVLTGIAAGVAGPGLLVVFGLNGVVALLTAMAYAELGSAFHDAGGGYLWVKTSLPDPNGFLSGWMSWFAHAVACSLYALGFGAYFRLVVESFGLHPFQLGFLTFEKALAVVVCVIFSVVNFRGASETGKAGNVVTVGKIAIIGVFIGAGLWAMAHRAAPVAPFVPLLPKGWGGVFAAMGLTFIAFEGYEIIAQTSEEVENPKRNVPRAVFLSLLIVVPIYLLVAIVAVGATTPPAGMGVAEFLGREKETALVTAAGQLFRGGGLMILVGGLLSTISALNATIYSSSRVAFAMARDANLPQALGRIHRTRATPHVAILVSALLVVAMAVALPIEDVAAAADIMFLLLFVQVNVAVIRLRKSRPDLDRGFRIPLMPVIPVAAIGTMLFLAFFLFTHYPLAWAAAGGWILVGAGVYYAYSRSREAAHVEQREWMERIERREYRVLVAVSNPATMRSLVEVAAAVARRHSGELIVTRIAEVPEGIPLMAGRHRAREAEPLLEEAVRYARDRGALARPVLRVSRRISHGIVATAREEGCNFVVLGGPARPSFIERLVATVVERVLLGAPCRVGVVYGEVRPGRSRQVVIPVTNTTNSRLAAELGPVLAEGLGTTTRAVTVVSPDLGEKEAADREREARETLASGGMGSPLEVLRRIDVGQALGEAIQEGDLVVLGAPSEGAVSGLLGETVPAVIAGRGRNPVVVVRDLPDRLVGRFERIFFRRR